MLWRFQNFRDVKSHPRIFPFYVFYLETWRHQLCHTHQKNIFENLNSHTFNFLKVHISQNVEIWKDGVFKQFEISFYFQTYFYITKEGGRTTCCEKMKVPKNVQKCIGICPQALINHFEPIINHKSSNIPYKYKK